MHTGEQACGAELLAAWAGGSVNTSARGGGAGQPALRVPLRPLGVRLRPCVSPAHPGASPASTHGARLKIAAHQSSGRASAAEATATAGESWPRSCGRLRSASGTETPAAQRGRRAPARRDRGPGGRLPSGAVREGRGGRGGLGAAQAAPSRAPSRALRARLSGLQGLGDSHEPVTTAGGGSEGDGEGGMAQTRPLEACRWDCRMQRDVPGTEWGLSVPHPPGERESLEELLVTTQHPTGSRVCFQGGFGLKTWAP